MSPYIAYGILPLVSTFIGGYAVLRWKRDLHPWLSLSGGVLLGVAFLDLFPEAMTLAGASKISPTWIFAMALAAIIFFHLVDKLLGGHHHEHAGDEPAEHCENDRHLATRAWVRASSMILHSFCDGLAIGSGFAANQSLGILVTLAVVMHDFSDGMSTVSIMKSARHRDRGALKALALDALAPFLGTLVGLKLAISPTYIAFLLAIFAGSFITLALSELLPQAHAGETRRFGLFLTLLGIGAVIFIRALTPV